MEEYKKKVHRFTPSKQHQNSAEEKESNQFQTQSQISQEPKPISTDKNQTKHTNQTITEPENQPLEKSSIPSFSHQQMKTLCNYALGTIRNKRRKGQSINAKDGFIYQYNQQLRKWLREND